ncbi:protein shisa-9-like [Mustelus asterias]
MTQQCGSVVQLHGVALLVQLHNTKPCLTEMPQLRALTDILKQQENNTMDYIERGGSFGTVQVPISLTPRTSRSSVDHPHLNNAAVTSPNISQMGPSHPHNNILQRMASAPPQGQDYSKYATLKAVAETAADEFYSKRYPVMELAQPGTAFPALAHYQKERQTGDTCGFVTSTPGPKTKVSKMNTHPLLNPGYKGWEQCQPVGRRHMHASKRQYSIEHLPEIFSPPPHYKQPQRHLSTNSKTEVTV